MDATGDGWWLIAKNKVVLNDKSMDMDNLWPMAYDDWA